ncbi:MAG: class I SAM-dependent methyltransferase [Chloroflexota bacterium]|nr:class I SAM-dependent methyltransferase [Chloroflexota bacterium]MDE2883753.1 class I SAM-dependent methyltransferase [Chloroflexota bacterium]
MTTADSRWNENAMVERMSSSRGRRYPPEFWAFFDSAVLPRIGDAPAIADLGCGPGLLLQDLALRLPGATLLGVDVSDAMLANAQALEFSGGAPSFEQHDLNDAPYPVENASLDLCVTASVTCFLDNPLVLFAEVRRTLRPGGVYLLYDWRRQTLADYIENRGGLDADPALMGVQPYHNRFTVDEWRWLLAESGFELVGEAHPRISHVALASVPR